MEYNTEIIKSINSIVTNIRRDGFHNLEINAIVEKFLTPIEYSGFWIAIIDEMGTIRQFYEKGISPLFEEKHFSSYEILVAEYIKENFFSENTIELDKDPIIKIYPFAEKDIRRTSITVKIHSRERTIGFLSIHRALPEQNIDNSAAFIEFLANMSSSYILELDQRKKIQYLEKRIKKSFDIFNVTLETTENATILIEENSIISFANIEFERLSGYKKADIEGKKSLFEFVSEHNLEQMKMYHHLRRQSSKAAPNNYNFSFIDRYSNSKDISITIDMVPGTNISIASFLNKSDIKKLESEIIRVSEEERQQIGNDLHDNLGPHFVGVQFLLKLMKDKVDRGILPEVEEVGEIYNLINEGINHIRKITKGLKPVEIQPESLMLTLKELASQTKRIFNINCSLNCNESISIDNNIITTHIFYIIQESINNAVKHASAKNINISIEEIKSSIIIEIEDDGKGIPEFRNSNGMGIDIMKYRASIINGSIDIVKNKNGGTTIRCTIN